MINKRLRLHIYLATAFFILPFPFIRILGNDWPTAIGYLFLLAMFGISAYQIHNEKKQTFSDFLVLSYASLVYTIVIMNSPWQVLIWCYPIVLAYYFILPSNQAIKLNVLLGLGISIKVINDYEFIATLRILSAFILTSYFSYFFSYLLTKKNQALKKLVSLDPLTEIFNRRELEKQIKELQYIHSRYSVPASILMLDLDHFKEINDNYGHEVGDKVLIQTVNIIKNRLRQSDLFFRYGGEEFVILLPNTAIRHAECLAHFFRKLISEATILSVKKVTISIGISNIIADEKWEECLSRADKNLYQAKNNGRNCCFSEPKKNDSR